MLPLVRKSLGYWNKSRKQEGKIKFTSRLLNVILKMNKEYKFLLLRRESKTAKRNEGRKRKVLQQKIFPSKTWPDAALFCMCIPLQL